NPYCLGLNLLVHECMGHTDNLIYVNGSGRGHLSLDVFWQTFNRVNAALEAKRVGRVNEGGGGSNTNETGGQDSAPPVCEFTFSSFMKCNPTPFRGKEWAIEPCRWFEKSEMVFSISDCAERNKVKFAAATLQGRALT
nr:putative reverse transcriptase domain-containing protein [Tanacetum cinerariifolium]